MTRMSKLFLSVLVFEAKGLVSSGENPEYDRALVELTTYATGGTQDDFLEISKEIFGIERPDLWEVTKKE